jgi:integrator complex subunit 3
MWQVRAGIYSSLRQIVDKKVLPALSPLFVSQRLDREIRAMLKVTVYSTANFNR